MTINNYSVIYKNYIITHPFFERANVIYGESFFIEFDSMYRMIKITINPNEKIPENNNLFCLSENSDPLPEGSYKLYPLLYLNDTPCIQSRIIYESMFSIFYLDSKILNNDTIKQITSKKPNFNSNEGDNHILILLRQGYLKQKDVKTGEIYTLYPNIELVQFLRNSRLLYPINDNFNKLSNFMFIRPKNMRSNKVYSNNIKIYNPLDEPLYLTAPHYADLVVRTLSEAYPEVHFFNTPADWGKEYNWKEYTLNNKKDYKEYIRYTVSTEDYSRARRDFHSNFGPVLYNVRIDINFEYATPDTETYIRRRTDLIIGQFISYYTHDSFKLSADLVGDNSNITGFPIHWVLDEALYAEPTLQRESDVVEGQSLSMHSIKFKCELYVRVLRFNRECPPIMKFIWTLIGANDNGEKTYTSEVEATQEQKEAILNRYGEGKYFKENELVEYTELGIPPEEDPNLKNSNVEITNNKINNIIEE